MTKQFSENDGKMEVSLIPPEISAFDVGRVDDPEIRELLLNFESVGNNCEFGMTQRRYNAEPMGLLRWNSTSVSGLMTGLAARFDGLGSPDNLEMYVAGSGEYGVRDPRYEFAMHTFLFQHQIDQEKLFPQMCRTLTYLTEKLFATIEAAEKVFIYKSETITLEEIRALHASLRTIGPVKLLCVKPASEHLAHSPFCGKAGEVFLFEEDLYFGFLSRFGTVADRWNIAFEEWVSICRSVARDALPSMQSSGA